MLELRDSYAADENEVYGDLFIITDEGELVLLEWLDGAGDSPIVMEVLLDKIGY